MSLLGNRDFRRLFAAQATSLLGSGITSVALAVFAYDLAGGNATVVVGNALMLRILAFVLVSPLAGVLADRLDRRRLLVAADLLRVALLGVFPFLANAGQVYLLIFAINAVTAFFTPAFEAAIPDVVGPRLYPRALAVSRIALAIEAALGPFVAGVLIALVGVRWTFWADAATYLVSALLILGARVPRAAAGTGEAPPAGSAAGRLVRQVTHGTRVLLREPALRRALVLHVAEATAGAAAIVATVVYVRDELGRGDAAFAATMMALGAGSSVAALVLARRAERLARGVRRPLAAHLQLHRWAGRVLVGGGAILSLALLPGILLPGLWTVLFLWALNGAGQSLIAIPSLALLAEHASREERGRAYAAHFALTHVFWLVTYPAVGHLARAVGTPWTFTLAGGVCVLAILGAIGISAPHRRHALQAA